MLENVSKNYVIEIFFSLFNKPLQSYKNQLYNVKDKNKPDENTEVVYKI